MSGATLFAVEDDRKEEEEKEVEINTDEEYFVTYTDLRDGESRVSLTAYTAEPHEHADFLIKGPYIVFCVGNGKPGLDGNLTRLHILILAKISNYPVLLNKNGNLVFVRALCKNENPSKDSLRNFKLFVSNSRLMFAYKNCYNFDQYDMDTEFSDMSIIVNNITSLRKLVLLHYFLY